MRESIGVTGASGNLGRRVVAHLAERGVSQKMIVRDPSRAPQAPGAQVAIADFDQPESFEETLAGIKTLFLVSAHEGRDRMTTHRRAVQAAARAGVERVVYTSFMGAAPLSTFTYARDHHHTELAIAESGMRLTALRNSLYADVVPWFVGDDGVIRAPAGSGRAAWVAREDVARVAVEVLLDDSHADQIYDVSGPVAIDMHETARLLSEVTGRPISYVEETIDEARASRAGAEEWQIDGWVGSYVAIATGETSVTSHTVEPHRTASLDVRGVPACRAPELEPPRRPLKGIGPQLDRVDERTELAGDSRRRGMKLEGVHHVTAITGDAPQNVEFYAGVLGLRMVKRTVNQDDPTVYHLFYADERGSAGSDITFFEYPGVPRGRAGDGMVHRVLFRVGSSEALDFWQKRLESEGITVERSESSLLFSDPEGLDLELVIDTSGDEPLRSEHPDVPVELALSGFDGVRAYSSQPEKSVSLFEETLGFAPQGSGEWSVRGERRAGSYRFDQAPEQSPLSGAGTVHHVAWASTIEEHDAWRARVADAGASPTPVIDRFYFKSIYFREPSGVLFEIATLGPGFTADEPLESLGEGLSLPPNYEHLRDKLADVLTPLPDPRYRARSQS